MKYLFCLFLSLWSLGSVFAQPTITLSGFVHDDRTGERLIGATVYIPSLKVGTHTNNYGFYSISIPIREESVALVSSYLGYEADTSNVMANKSIQLDFTLKTKTFTKEVVIKSKKSAPIQESTQMSKIELSVATLKKLPAFLGEVDILRSIQLLPGIQAGSEGQTGIYVRGGGPDQNLILLDGIPVYNASHLFGFFSVFNADAVNSVDVYKGGFPARYGGRLSSVIDIRMKEGNKKELRGSLGIGLIASRLMLEGPINKKKDKGSWMISGRRTYIDILAAPLIKASLQGDGGAGYYFYDLNAKANYQLGKKDHIYLSAYTGQDRFYFNFSEAQSTKFKGSIDWGNFTGLLRWNHVFSSKVFGNLSATQSRYQFSVFNKITSKDFNNKESSFSALYASKIRDWALKYDIDYVPNTKHYIKTGISSTFHRFVPGALQVKNTDFPSDNIDTAFNIVNAPELDLYVEDDIEFTAKWKANIGLHLSGFKTKQNWYASWQPRVSTRYLITPMLSAKASFASMAQFIHLLTNNGIGLPTDLWVPVTDRIKPQQSHQVAVGLAQSLANDYEISVEGYYKWMKNIIDYKDGVSFLNTNQSWEDKVEMGKGWSYGGELFIQKKSGRLTGMMGYTLSWTNRQFPTINFGKRYPYKYDRRHDFKIAGVYHVSKKIELSADWVYGTGNAISMPLFRYNTASGYNPGSNFGGDIFYYGDRNNFRMRAYHRMDLGINFIKAKKNGGERIWNISVYNAYSRRNPYFIYSDYNYTQQKYNFRQISLFPILPSFSYNLKF